MRASGTQTSTGGVYERWSLAVEPLPKELKADLEGLRLTYEFVRGEAEQVRLGESLRDETCRFLEALSRKPATWQAPPVSGQSGLVISHVLWSCGEQIGRYSCHK